MKKFFEIYEDSLADFLQIFQTIDEGGNVSRFLDYFLM